MHLPQPCSWQPLILRREPPGQDPEKGDRSENDRRVIESRRGDWEVQRGKQHASQVQVPDESDECQGATPATEAELSVLELMRRDKASAEGDKRVGGNSWHAGGADQGGERHRRREDGTE